MSLYCCKLCMLAGMNIDQGIKHIVSIHVGDKNMILDLTKPLGDYLVPYEEITL